MSEKISERLKNLMEEKRYSKAEISEKLGIGYSTLWRRLNGERSINIDFLMELASALGTSIAYLVGETDNPEPNGAEAIHIQEHVSGKSTATTNYAYWGGVVDEANKVAERGDAREISSIEPLLKLAYDALSSGKSKLKSPSVDSSVVAHMPVYGGHHNENKMTVKTA